MKFNLTSLAGLTVSQATLRMWVTSGSPGNQSIKQVADTSWTENAITWNNRPPKGAEVTNFIYICPATCAWNEVDITSAVTAAAGAYMSIAMDNNNGDGYRFNSDEATSNRLELVVSWSGGAGGPTPTATPTATPTGTPTATPTRTPTPGPGTPTPTPGPTFTPGPTPNPNGYKGPSYTGATAPTAEKPQSKLWFNDGIWWGSLFTAGDFRIHRLNWATQTWTDTGVLIDTRNGAHVDALWDGTKLYVVSVVPFNTGAAELRRYSYNATTDAYTIDSGFPLTIVSGISMETIVLAKDSTNKLWITYTTLSGTNTNAVWVARTTTSDTTWGTPFTPPVGNIANLSADDLSTIVAFDSKIGVMWGNQNTQTYYFATHADGVADMTWLSSVALAIPEGADDHINLKALSGDSAGRVFAAVKTSLNSSSDPLIMLLVLKPNGTWENHTFSTAGLNQTRPIVQIDSQNRKLYVFAAQPCCSGDVIYYKQTSLDAISFPPGSGTSFMDGPDPPTDNCINNVSSTKQNLNNATDLVAIAGADCVDFYFHNKIDLP